MLPSGWEPSQWVKAMHLFQRGQKQPREVRDAGLGGQRRCVCVHTRAHTQACVCKHVVCTCVCKACAAMEHMHADVHAYESVCMHMSVSGCVCVCQLCSHACAPMCRCTCVCQGHSPDLGGALTGCCDAMIGDRAAKGTVREWHWAGATPWCDGPAHSGIQLQSRVGAGLCCLSASRGRAGGQRA